MCFDLGGWLLFIEVDLIYYTIYEFQVFQEFTIVKKYSYNNNLASPSLCQVLL